MSQSQPLSGSASFLIQNTIVPVDETYYLVTETQLKTIKERSVFADLFMFFASISWGAYVSVIIALKVSVDTPEKIASMLSVYGGMLFLVAIFLTILAVVFLIVGYLGIQKLTKRKLDLETGKLSTVDEEIDGLRKAIKGVLADSQE